MKKYKIQDTGYRIQDNHESCIVHHESCIPVIFFIYLLLAVFGFIPDAFAVPGTEGVRVTDVTTSSFSVVWKTDVSAEPTVEVYSNGSLTNQITNKFAIAPMPGGSEKVIESARSKGIMKVRVSGLSPATRYYVRTVTKDPSNPSSIGYSQLYEVLTASKVVPYRYSGGSAKGFSNDLLSFKIHIRPSDKDLEPGLGDLIILESDSSPYPISTFVGDWISSPEGILDLNNLFGTDNLSLDLTGGEKIILRIYRERTLSTLTHYRKTSQDGDMLYVSESVKGFFADINLDSKVDDSDFSEFKKQYRTLPDDASYNPDFNFVNDEEDKVDVREFSKFSREYGRTDVE